MLDFSLKLFAKISFRPFDKTLVSDAAAADGRRTKSATGHVCGYGSITENENIRQFVVIRCNSTFISTFNLSTSDDLKY